MPNCAEALKSTNKNIHSKCKNMIQLNIRS